MEMFREISYNGFYRIGTEEQKDFKLLLIYISLGFLYIRLDNYLIWGIKQNLSLTITIMLSLTLIGDQDISILTSRWYGIPTEIFSEIFLLYLITIFMTHTDILEKNLPKVLSSLWLCCILSFFRSWANISLSLKHIILHSIIFRNRILKNRSNWNDL